MVFDQKLIKKIEELLKEVKELCKVSELKSCLVKINNILDESFPKQVITWVQNQIKQINETIQGINCLIADDYEDIAQEMTEEFNTPKARRLLINETEHLKNFPERRKESLITVYIRLSREKIQTTKKPDILRNFSFYLSEAQWEVELRKKLDARFNTDNVKNLEQERLDLEKFQQFLKNVRHLKKYKNPFAIDKINASIQLQIDEYKRRYELIKERSNCLTKMMEDQKSGQSGSDVLEDLSYLTALLKHDLEELDAYLNKGEYSIDYLDMLKKIIQDTCSMLLFAGRLSQVLRALPIISISYIYTRGKTPQSSSLVLTINGGTPIRFTGLRAQNLHKMFLKCGISLDTEEFKFSSLLQKKPLSERTENFNKECAAMNRRVADMWREYGFVFGEFDLIDSKGYSHGINKELKKFIK